MTDPADTRCSARFFALIPCAGQGSRAGMAGGQAKQYQAIDGLPMVLHTLAAFQAVGRLARTLVVVAQDDRFFESRAGARFDVAACGGAHRADSVRQGLDVLRQAGAEASDWVLVHDAARCLVTPEQINQLIDACQHDDVGGLLAHKLPDTLKCEVDGRVSATLDRSDKWLAQTPQMFRMGTLLQALDTAESTGSAVTDESSAIEALGLTPKLVSGSAQNFKVTYPQDFALAEAILLNRRRPA
ncbi:2-C-methyl-D-erythritol 4-phosphate cytidylyltransferase [Polaromonas sp. CG_9.11]|uniref:2-C-methyl-D-erythritol 4-phosphate cytidylyltransferase n=1 Tax=Polaromonas sp. CG_9.11 TaxID=2787730 RepID=UPI0018CBA6CC|nr:2-C-methyl-D-erythritol 4-phosphate cytidylyltransferase [Polaromonas sp. CG_9.11]MBG6074475.1 2-C-methyl-D-erythritol 4-phosphate cytidylyltransferase [Polaromonas sp. CG_9.11]